MSQQFRFHGGPTDGDHDYLDFSVNLNFYGPSPSLKAAVAGVDYSSYPDPTASKLRQQIAMSLDWDPEGILIGNGACELIWLLAYRRRGSFIAAVEPTFCELRAAADAYQVPMESVHGFRLERSFDLVKLKSYLEKKQPGTFYICNPNSPTGHYIQHERLMNLCSEFPKVEFILDQAFLNFSDHYQDMGAPVPLNVIRLRSLTKDHAIAGLRLGYLMGAPKLCQELSRWRPFWSVNALAQVAGQVAITESKFVEDSRQKMFEDRDYLRKKLGELGLRPAPSVTNFLMVDVGDGQQLSLKLEDQGVRVRPCRSYGLPEYIRLSARPRQDVDHLMEALRRCL